MEYYIIHCNRCATPQYITSAQKTRKCPRCGNRIICNKMKIFGRTNSIKEANLIVRSIKTPNEIQQRINLLSAQTQNSKNQKDFQYKILADLISELIAIFPKAMPKELLISEALKIGIENSDFIVGILSELNEKGLVIINQDNQRKDLLFFPSVPFKYKNMYVKKPKTSQDFNKESGKKWKALKK